MHPLFKSLQPDDRLWFKSIHNPEGVWIIFKEIKGNRAHFQQEYESYGQTHLLPGTIQFDSHSSDGINCTGKLYKSPEEEQVAEQLTKDQMKLARLLGDKRFTLSREQLGAIAKIAGINL